jgi:hypothetical protein
VNGRRFSVRLWEKAIEGAINPFLPRFEIRPQIHLRVTLEILALLRNRKDHPLSAAINGLPLKGGPERACHSAGRTKIKSAFAVQPNQASGLLIVAPMRGMHSHTKEQREVVRDLLHRVLMRDMGTFNPEQFKDWIKDTDARFRRVGLTLRFEIRNRTVNFTIREIRTKRTIFRFASSTHVRFDDRSIVMSAEELAPLQ